MSFYTNVYKTVMEMVIALAGNHIWGVDMYNGVKISMEVL
jgi:hypothetical protein